uniref:OTU domain-containing protein 5 n=2 Tax=Sarcophilus harrisii TaxID=9305 RepID=A0A7N4NIZ4_SARHA
SDFREKGGGGQGLPGVGAFPGFGQGVGGARARTLLLWRGTGPQRVSSHRAAVPEKKATRWPLVSSARRGLPWAFELPGCSWLFVPPRGGPHGSGYWSLSFAMSSLQQEHWFEKALRDKKGFIIKQMKEDGACLFRAVADQVYGDQDMHEVVRKHCMDYLMKNADYFSNYVTEDFTTYINRKRKNNCHGNHIEMQAMAEMYNRPVEVYQYSTEPINTFHGIQQNEDEPIRVSYHRNVHYNSVVNPNKATIGVGLGLPSFKPGFADQSLMKNAIKTSEESWIEQQMLEDKKRATDWEATNEAIEEQVARESYLQWLRDQEKQARQVRGQAQPRKASATCSSATAAASSGLEEWSGRSPRQRSTAPSPEQQDLHPELGPKPPSPGHALTLAKPPSPCAPGPSSQLVTGGDRATSPLVSLYPALECRALIQQMSPSAFGLNDWDDDEILASVLAVSQQEYLDSMKKNTVHRDPPPDKS